MKGWWAMNLFVRNSGKIVGVDWKVALALAGILVGLVAERTTVLAHVARVDAAWPVITEHIINVGDWRHMTEAEYRAQERSRMLINARLASLNQKLAYLTQLQEEQFRRMGWEPPPKLPDLGPIGPDTLGPHEEPD